MKNEFVDIFIQQDERLKVLVFIYGLILTMAINFLPLFIISSSGTLLVIFSAVVWGIKGGLVAAIWASIIICIMSYGMNLSFVLAGVTVYFIIGIGLGKTLSIIKQQQQILASEKEKRNLLLDNIAIQVWYLKDFETYGIVNQIHANFLGASKEEVENKKIYTFFDTQEEVTQIINKNQEVFTNKKQLKTEGWFKDNEGQNRLLDITRIPKLNQRGEVEYVVCYAEDITEHRQAEDKIHYISFHDTLTGLYNRSYLEKEMERIDVKRQLPISLIIADINGLKLVNDGFGHEMGDKLIKKVADVIKNSCREEDIVARWGGDEFVVLLPQTTNDKAEEIVNRIKSNADQKTIGEIPLSVAFGYGTKTSIHQDLQQVLQKADDVMYKNKLMEGESFRGNMLSKLLKTLKEKSNETEEHFIRIGRLAFMLGEVMDLSEEQLDKLSLLATLHDIGKIAVPEKILKQETELTPEEWEAVKNHSESGYHIVNSSDQFSYIAQEILTHHEYWDGSGYPRGLAEEEIPLLGRIFAVLDAYDVMVNGRPYQKAITNDEAVKELKRCAGTQFDPEVVEKFIQILN